MCPTRLPSRFATTGSRSIGITTSDLSVAFFPNVLKAVESAFLPQDYATLSSSTYDDPKTKKRFWSTARAAAWMRWGRELHGTK